MGKPATNPGWSQIPPICPSLYSRAPAHKTKVANYRMLSDLQGKTEKGMDTIQLDTENN